MVICFQDVRFELGHISARKRMQESDHLIEKTAQRPNIAFERIRPFLPNLGTGIVRCSYFCNRHAVLADRAHVHVTYFYAVADHKKICCFHIAVKDVGAMETAESVCHLSRKSAELLLGEGSFGLATLHHQLKEISALCEFSDEAEVFPLEEGLSVLDDVGMVEPG